MGDEKRKFFPEMLLIPVFSCQFSHSPDKTVLWSSTKVFTEVYAVFNGLCTLERTPPGRYLKGLPRILKIIMKGLTDNGKLFVRELWGLASERIARYVAEEVIVILDGDKEKPFNPGSMLAREIKKLKYPKVKTVNVLMITHNNKESCCTEEKLSELREALDPSISLTCEAESKAMPVKIVVCTIMCYIYQEAKQRMS